MSCAPIFSPVPLQRPKRPFPALQVRRLGRPAPLHGNGFPFPDAPAAPRYLVLGCPRCSGSPRSPRGSSGPPLSQAGAGGAAPPRGAVGFSNTNTAPPCAPAPPPSHGPASPRAEVPPLEPRPAFGCPARLDARAQQDARWRVPGASYPAQPRSLPDEPLFHSDHARFRNKPRPARSNPAPRLSHTRFRPHRPAPSFKATPPASQAPFPRPKLSLRGVPFRCKTRASSLPKPPPPH